MGVCEAGSGSAISHWILSWCPDTGALPACEGGREGCCFKAVTVSYPQTPHYTPLATGRFIRLSTAVSIKLGGQLEKTITLCIKHARVSNSSSPSSVFYPVPLLSLRSDGRRTSHSGNLRDFYTRGGGKSAFFFLDPARGSRSSCHTTLGGLRECAGVERDSNCRECIISHMFKCCTPSVALIDK